MSAHEKLDAVLASCESADTTVRVEKDAAASVKTTDLGNGSTRESAETAVVSLPPAQDVEEDNEDEVKRSKTRIGLIMLALSLALFLAALDSTVVTTALPTMTEYFQSETVYVWVGTSYLLALAATTITWAKLSDIYGRKPVLLAANAIFFVGALLAALSVNVAMLLVGRAVQGAGGGGLMVLTNVCIGDLFSPRDRGAYYGVVSGVWAVALALGPVVGGLLTERVSWRWCFWINLPFDAAAFIIMVLFLDIKTPKTPLLEGLKMIDWGGAALSVGGTLMLLLGLSFGGVRNPWNSPVVICLIVFGLVAWVLFFLYEMYQAKYPLVPARLFYSVPTAVLVLLCIIQASANMMSTYYLPLYFQAILGASPILSGVYILPLGFGLSVSSLVAGQYIRKTGSYHLVIGLGFPIMMLGFGLFIPFGSTANWALIVLAQIIAGMGVGPNFSSPLIALQSLVHPRYLASITSAYSFIRTISSSISVVIAQAILQNRTRAQYSALAAAVGDRLAGEFVEVGVVGSSKAITALPAEAQAHVREAFANSFKAVWIYLTAISAVAVFVMLFIRKAELSSDHKETKTGLEAEREARVERLAEEQARRSARLAARVRQSGSTETEKTEQV